MPNIDSEIREWTTTDEVKFLYFISKGNTYTTPENISFKMTPIEKLTKYINAMNTRKNWSPINKNIIKIVTSMLYNDLKNFGFIDNDWQDMYKNAIVKYKRKKLKRLNRGN